MKPHLSKWLWGMMTAGSLTLLLFLAFQTQLNTVAATWKRFPWTYFLFAQLVYLLLNFLRSWRFNVLLKDSHLPWQALFTITAFYNLSARILPFRSGDLVYPILLRRHVPSAWTKGFGGVTGSLLFDLLILMAVNVMALLAIRNDPLGAIPFTNVLIASVCLFFLALGAIFLIGTLSTSLAHFLRSWSTGFWQSLADNLGALSENLSHFRHLRVFGPTLLLSCLITGAIFAFQLILLRGQNVWAGWAAMITCVALVMLISSLPLALFGLGVIEGAWVLGLVNLAGQSLDEAVALGIFLHSCQILAAIITALVGFLLARYTNQTICSATIRN